MAWNMKFLGHQIQEGFFNQIWPSAGHRIIGKFRWRFSQTFVIQVYIVEEAVSTWIVCFLWNHYLHHKGSQ